MLKVEFTRGESDLWRPAYAYAYGEIIQLQNSDVLYLVCHFGKDKALMQIANNSCPFTVVPITSYQDSMLFRSVAAKLTIEL